MEKIIIYTLDLMLHNSQYESGWLLALYMILGIFALWGGIIYGVYKLISFFIKEHIDDELNSRLWYFEKKIDKLSKKKK